MNDQDFERAKSLWEEGKKVEALSILGIHIPADNSAKRRFSITSGSKKKMISPEQIDQGILEIAALTAAHQIPVLLVGGAAMQLYGSDRFTADLDFAAGTQLPELPAEEPLTFGGYQSHTPSGVPVDWIVRADDYRSVYEEAIQYPRRLEGVSVPVVSPEYLVAMKMVARRRKDELDLETLLELGVVNVEKAQRIVRRLLGAYASDDLQAHLELAAWNRSRKG